MDTSAHLATAMVNAECNDLYELALSLEPRLRRVECMVQTQVEFIREEDRFCNGCYWELVLKPLVTPWVGYSRGHAYEPITADDWYELKFERGDEVLEQLEQRDRETALCHPLEVWLRSREAFDIVTNRMLKLVDAADHGLGHGFCQAVVVP